MAYTFRKANFNPISSLWMLVITLQFHVCSRVYIQCFDLSTLKIVLVFCITRLSVLRTNKFLCGVAGGNTRCVQRNRRSVCLAVGWSRCASCTLVLFLRFLLLKLYVERSDSANKVYTYAVNIST